MSGDKWSVLTHCVTLLKIILLFLISLVLSPKRIMHVFRNPGLLHEQQSAVNLSQSLSAAQTYITALLSHIVMSMHHCFVCLQTETRLLVPFQNNQKEPKTELNIRLVNKNAGTLSQMLA